MSRALENQSPLSQHRSGVGASSRGVSPASGGCGSGWRTAGAGSPGRSRAPAGPGSRRRGWPPGSPDRCFAPALSPRRSAPQQACCRAHSPGKAHINVQFTHAAGGAEHPCAPGLLHPVVAAEGPPLRYPAAQARRSRSLLAPVPAASRGRRQPPGPSGTPAAEAAGAPLPGALPCRHAVALLTTAPGRHGSSPHAHCRCAPSALLPRTPRLIKQYPCS